MRIAERFHEFIKQDEHSVTVISAKERIEMLAAVHQVNSD